MVRTTSELNGHPWVALADLDCEGTVPPNARAVSLYAADGTPLGSGIYDARDPRAAWRRFSLAEGVDWSMDYIVEALQAAIARRPEEACQRLVSSDADYLPGLIVELYQDVLLVSAETAAVEAHLESILEVLQEGYQPREIVVRSDSAQRSAYGLSTDVRTLSGNRLKGYWIEVDGLQYRIDLLNTSKPCFHLDQREQHALVGSLCAERRVLDCSTSVGGFALQALQQGACGAVALDVDPMAVKAIGANAQKNGLSVDALATDVSAYLGSCEAGRFDAIVLDPPATLAADAAALAALQRQAFAIVPPGGLLATYCRDVELSAQAFESLLAGAAAAAGREARIFARTAQPFDFPMLLCLPQSQALKGLIVQVE
ncbi:MAG: class I SAM-dependent rRNA methyltransferase [Opitutales bacterium]